MLVVKTRLQIEYQKDIPVIVCSHFIVLTVFSNFPLSLRVCVPVMGKVCSAQESNCGPNITQFLPVLKLKAHTIISESSSTAGRVSGLSMMMDCPQRYGKGEKIGTTFVLIVFGGDSIKKDIAPVKMSKVGLSSINLI